MFTTTKLVSTCYETRLYVDGLLGIPSVINLINSRLAQVETKMENKTGIFKRTRQSVARKYTKGAF